MVWKQRERLIDDKKQKTQLILRKDSTYIKRYWGYDLPGDSIYQLRYSADLGSGLTRITVTDSMGNATEIKKMERGTYSVSKSKQVISFTSENKTYQEYTLENGYLVVRISTEGILNSTEKWVLEKFKRKG